MQPGDQCSDVHKHFGDSESFVHSVVTGQVIPLLGSLSLLHEQRVGGILLKSADGSLQLIVLDKHSLRGSPTEQHSQISVEASISYTGVAYSHDGIVCPMQ
ncbi:MAG: hypothetical protein EZS28_036838 [Streblomastix strix]|uniref:Uncharacterized protein n=1 Tax=Streblomastix strix TaxID=222440 RepID=A0A5J4UBP1_9EUKA|nr:MAG: hypothetical protein EZS28_036838 [Streblomastix strix]